MHACMCFRRLWYSRKEMCLLYVTSVGVFTKDLYVRVRLEQTQSYMTFRVLQVTTGESVASWLRPSSVPQRWNQVSWSWTPIRPTCWTDWIHLWAPLRLMCSRLWNYTQWTMCLVSYSTVFNTVDLLCSAYNPTRLTINFVFTETFMGTKVNAQQGCEAEYVRALCM
jgi:hypothetical protein